MRILFILYHVTKPGLNRVSAFLHFLHLTQVAVAGGASTSRNVKIISHKIS